jgi:hydrogenase maturation protease
MPTSISVANPSDGSVVAKGRKRCLVIGYGNDLLGDDGVGCYIAQRLESLQHPDIDTIEAVQLLPEMVETISRYRQIFFVDAAIDTGDHVSMTMVDGKTENSMHHAVSPEWLLSIVSAIYSCSPEALLLRVPANQFALGEPLSRETAAAAEEAIVSILRCVEDKQNA